MATSVTTAADHGMRVPEVRGVTAGERPANLAQLVVVHQAPVSALVRRLLGWRGEVDEAVQETFVAAFENLAKFRGESQFSTWLYRIAVNVCRKQQRRARWRAWLRFRSITALERTPSAGFHCEAIADRPGAACSNRETATLVREAVQALSVLQREVIVLHYLEDLPIVDVAAILGVSRGVVDVRLNRARVRLREQLGAAYEGLQS